MTLLGDYATMLLCDYVAMCIFDNATIWHITPGLLSLIRRSVRGGASLSITVIAGREYYGRRESSVHNIFKPADIEKLTMLAIQNGAKLFNLVKI